MATRTSKTALVLAAAVIGVAMAGQARAATVYTFAQTAGGTYNWNGDNWAAAGAFPNLIDDTANLNVNIASNTTINLGAALQNITVGALNLGDSDGTAATTIGSGFAGNTLTFQSAGTASLTMSMGGTVHAGSTINAPVALQSAMTFNMGSGATATNSQYLTLNGNVTTNGNDITLTNGYMVQKLNGTPVDGVVYATLGGQNAFNLNGDLVGSGTLTNNSGGSINITQYTTAGVKSFTGKVVLNSGRGSSASGYFGSLMLNGLSSIKNSSELVVNGYYMAGASGSDNGLYAFGGTVNIGDNQAVTSNPGTRLSSNKVTLNGGTLQFIGQRANTTTWTTASTDVVQDTVATLNFNSGMSYISMVRDTSTAGTRLRATTVQRSPGATLYLGNTDANNVLTQLVLDNASDVLVGGTGSTTTNKKIIPWIITRMNLVNTKNPTGFVYYDPTLGVRAIGADATTAYAASFGIDPTDNVSTSGVVSTSPTANSLRTSGTLTINKNQVVNITSGALMLNGGTGIATATGAGTDGTINFGGAEGVIWATQVISGNYRIGAAIAGSNGITKYGFGKLILSGNNTYTGQTYLSGGILQVGDDTTTITRLGDGDVHVAAGGLLDIRALNVINDNATLWLDTFGPAANGVLGKVNLGTGVNETVAGLDFGSLAQVPGTYGATGSGATFINDTYFTGGGILTVVPVPEPASLALMGIGGLMLLRRRRSR